ncbi:hypothetical protein HELRODRAFT_66974, partial [Helobdella robusta]|uniref:EGF-like domain-containing protein n=1 Tax=Helobdella robusta TaxID=6412 RepID=T1FYU3_HELRO
PAISCSDVSCSHGGLCTDQSGVPECDCTMTSFFGSTCDEGHIAYQFNSKSDKRPSTLTLDLPERDWTTTSVDVIVFGIITNQSDANLWRLSSNTSRDFIEAIIVSVQTLFGYLSLSLDDGHLMIIYDVANEQLPVGLFFHRIDDGKYHVINFVRIGPNATLKVDDHMPQPKQPQGDDDDDDDDDDNDDGDDGNNNNNGNICILFS